MNRRLSFAALSISAIFCMALFLISFNDAQAGRRGGGGRGFSRGGAAAGGGFSSRASVQPRQRTQQPSRQVQNRTYRGQQPAARPDKRPADRPDTRPADRVGRDGDRDDIREDRQDHLNESREDRQDHLNESREDRQNYADDQWDDHHYGGYHGGVVIVWSGVQTTYVFSAPCNETVKVNGDTFYHCSSDWYQRATVNGDVVYVYVSAPPGY